MGRAGLSLRQPPTKAEIRELTAQAMRLKEKFTAVQTQLDKTCEASNSCVKPTTGTARDMSAYMKAQGRIVHEQSQLLKQSSAYPEEYLSLLKQIKAGLREMLPIGWKIHAAPAADPNNPKHRGRPNVFYSNHNKKKANGNWYSQWQKPTDKAVRIFKIEIEDQLNVKF